MPFFKKDKNILLFILALTLLIGYFYIKNSRDYDYSKNFDYEETKNSLLKEVEKYGPEKTYKKFKKKIEKNNPIEQHLITHIFGEVLFDKEGVGGLIYCDNSFQSACFHGLFGKAVYSSGDSVISEMDKYCLKEEDHTLSANCQHGLGHGLLQYTGYDNLEDALFLCDNLTNQKDPLFGCTGGVFMEYNFPSLNISSDSSSFNGFTIKHRDFDLQNPYKPCDTLPYKFKKACYHGLVSIWYPPYRTYHKINDLCHNLPESEFVTACFEGFGRNIPLINSFDLIWSREICLTDTNEEEALACLSGARSAFESMDEYKDLGVEICNDLHPLMKEKCLLYLW